MTSLPTRWVIGIDEVGRGPLAGPVVVAGVRMELRIRNQELGLLKGIKDSKKLTPKQREEWFRILTNHTRIVWAVARVWPRVIDRINISRAANLGAWRVFQSLTAKNQIPLLSSDRVLTKTFSLTDARALLDAGLALPEHVPHEAIIRGDEKEPLIAAASIIAKVTRDRIMARLHKKYPRYGFDQHKGYGTRMHRDMIARFGPSVIHRISFRLFRG